MTPFINCTLGQFTTEGQVVDLIQYMSQFFLPPPPVSDAVLSSAVLSIIGATLITSLVWSCAVIKMRKKRDVDMVSTQQESMSRLTPFQGNISLQDNVAYGQVGSRIRK